MMTDRTARPLLLIADDYGLGTGHDDAMRQLVRDNAIDAVSVLVECCDERSAHALSGVRADCLVGLHFNITYAPRGQPARPTRLAWLLGGFFGLGRRQVRAALDAQLERFQALFGTAPDFIDGHEHCHVYPTIAEIVLARAQEKGIPVRSLRPLWPAPGLKGRLLAWLGRRHANKAARMGVKTNRYFAGVLPLDQPERAIALLDETLKAAEHAAATGKNLWVMCHPGDAEDPAQTPGHAPALRRMEFELLRRRAAEHTPPR